MPAEVAAIVLAAGRASRFGAGLDDSKVFAMLGGKPLVAHAVAAARASQASHVVVVTGHAAHRAAAALEGVAPDAIVHNPDYGEGMASSLKLGLAAVPPRCTGALVMLADMPLVAPATLDALIECFSVSTCEAVVPRHAGRRGNPVLLGRILFEELSRLRGDLGARGVLAKASVLDCDVDDPGVLADVDTRAALAAIAGPQN